MGDANFTIESVQEILSSINELKSNIERCLEDCNNEINMNVNESNGWKGNAASDYKARWDKAYSNFGDFVELINKLQTTISDNIEDQSHYDKTTFVA